MGEIVELHGPPAPTKDDSEFVTDLARFAEAIVSEADIKRKYRFGDEVWAKLGDDDELVRQGLRDGGPDARIADEPERKDRDRRPGCIRAHGLLRGRGSGVLDCARGSDETETLAVQRPDEILPLAVVPDRLAQ